MRFNLKHTYLLFFALFAVGVFNFCKNEPTANAKSNYLNLADSVTYVGMATCRSCHDNVHQTFINTGMGRSFHHANRANSNAQFGSHAVVYDTLNDLFYYPFLKNDTAFYVLEYRLEGTDTVHKRLEKIDYIIGSGQHTNSHIIDVNGYIYQAPVTWYSQDKKWDMAPGFRENNSRFGRWLTDECITCHNHFPKQVEGSLNKFMDMPTGIECERCHGPGEVHVKEKLAGILVDTAVAIDYTIVNPRDLPRDRQMDLCQRCHLQGIAVTTPGHTFFDFKPGMRLNQVMNVYLPRYTDSHERFIMASQADRLRLSKCFIQTDELTCLTCHHPHHSVEVTPKGQFNSACESCHDTKKCTLPISEREQNSNDCSGCHMPKSGSIDIPHVKITDHNIGIHRPKPGASNQQKQFLGLEILTKNNPTPLDMAKGYLAMHDKYLASPLLLDSVAHYLQLVGDDEEKMPVEVHYYFLRNDVDQLIAFAPKLANDPSPEPWTAYRIGEAFFQKGEYRRALSFFEMAVAGLPLHLDFLEKKGVTLAALNQLSEAELILNKVLAENPKRPVALCNLGFVYVLSGKISEGEAFYDKAISLDPDYVQALLNKAAVLIFQQNKKEAKVLLERVLKIDPGNEQAVMGLGEVRGER